MKGRAKVGCNVLVFKFPERDSVNFIVFEIDFYLLQLAIDECVIFKCFVVLLVHEYVSSSKKLSFYN